MTIAGPLVIGSVTVLTFNVNYGLSSDTATLDAIANNTADVVCLQETNAGWERAIRGRLSGTYPHMKFHDAGAAGGMAILSKHPVKDAEVSHPRGAWFAAWKFVVAHPDADVQILQVHLRPPFSDKGSVVSGYVPTKKIRHAELTDHLKLLDADLPTIVVGDFNERKGRATQLLKKRGMRDILPMFAKRPKTWRWKTRVGQVSGQLDHIFADDQLEPTRAEVINAGRSDHFPVIATFDLL